MATRTSTIPSDAVLVEGLMKRIAGDLEMMLGHALRLGPQRVERAHTRPAGAHEVHISFKLVLSPLGAPERHGALLVPLREALTMGCFLLMIPEEQVALRREDAGPDPALKDALLEIGNMIGGATQTALAELGLAGWSARSEGCQGVRADVRPAFPYLEGSELLVARCEAALEPFASFEALLILPVLG